MIDQSTKTELQKLNELINVSIDRLIIKRDEANGRDKLKYRHVVRKLEAMLTPLSKAMDEVGCSK